MFVKLSKFQKTENMGSEKMFDQFYFHSTRSISVKTDRTFSLTTLLSPIKI